MSDEDWDVGFAKSLAMYLNGHGIRETDERGEPVVDDCFYLAFNASHEPIEFTLPGPEYAEGWSVVVDSSALEDVEQVEVKAGDKVTLEPRSLIVLQAAP
jgi:isoamylase